MNTWYCGKQCQEEDWDNHKESCRKQTQDIYDLTRQIKHTWASKHRSPMPNPYYIGNAIAVDMLNLENNECKDMERFENHPGLKNDYSVLSVGCGNLRNFIHTVACLPSAFQGRLHTVLNDFDPFIQARNVLFLFMMIAFADMEGIAGIVSTIWYSLRLSKTSYNFLADCLRTLTQITKTSLAEMTRGIIDMSEQDLDLIKKVWRKWLSLECNRRRSSCINLRKQRQKLVENESDITRIIDEYKRELDPQYVESFEEWLNRGIFLGSAAARSQYLQYDNPTLTGFIFAEYASRGLDTAATFRRYYMFGIIDHLYLNLEEYHFVYCVPPDLHPFGSWDHLLVQKFSSTANSSLIDMYYSYITDQIQICIDGLMTSKLTISVIVMECTDLDGRSRHLQTSSQFDRIFTSNVADYVGTYKLLATFKQFLNTNNKCATIITQYWNWYLHPSGRNFDNPYQPLDFLLQWTDSGVLPMQRALIDTGKVVMSEGHYQEYFNSTNHFIRFLRADFTASLRQRSGTTGSESSLVTFKEVKQSLGLGLRMRDFRKELNTVVPFQYRRNVRQVNMLRGQTAHMIEWYIP